ncbi:MAG: ZIP family metal transporter, partial [Actinomycetota bacterium]
MAEARAERPMRIPGWLAALGPLVLVAALVVVFLVTDPIGELREVPPVESIAVERTVFTEDGITLKVRNDGPDPVTIAQVLVNDAYWNFSMGDQKLERLESATIELRGYPWDEGLPVGIGIITSTGVVIEHEVEAAALTPEADASTLGIYALLGVYIGVIPVTVGLLWFPALKRARRGWLDFFLAFTAGLLVFLLIDTTEEGLELASETGAALNAVALFGIGALGAVLGLVALGHALSGRQGAPGLVLAYLIAAGIGLHNL